MHVNIFDFLKYVNSKSCAGNVPPKVLFDSERTVGDQPIQAGTLSGKPIWHIISDFLFMKARAIMVTFEKSGSE